MLDNETFDEYANSGKTLVYTTALTDYFRSDAGTYVRNWKYFEKTLSGTPCTSAANGTYVDGGGYGDWLAFKVKGISEGTYNVIFGKPASNQKGCVWAMYILDGETYANADNEAITSAIGDTLGNDVVKVGEFDTYANANASIDLGNVGIKGNEADEYIVVFKAIRDGKVDEGETAPTNSSGGTQKSSRFIAMTSLTFIYVSEYVAPPEVATEKTIGFTKSTSGLSEQSGAVSLNTITDYITDARDWQFFIGGCSGSHITGATVTDSAGVFMNGGAHINDSSVYTGDWLALKIRGLAESDYKVTFGSNGNKRGCVWGMYVLDNEKYGSAVATAITTAIDTMADGVKKIGEFDLYGNTKKAIEVGTVKLSGRSTTEHIILFRAERDGTLSAGEVAPTEESGKIQAYLSMMSLTFTPVDADDMANDAFAYEEASHNGGDTSVVAYAVYGTDGTVSETAIITTPSATYGEVCKVEAPGTAKVDDKDYTFLYWAKGMTMDKKQVVSKAASFDYLPREGANYLIAVYGEDDAEADNKTEFYNANGQLLTDVTVSGGVMPGYPSMAGFGKARAWALRNADGSYIEYEEGDEAPASGMFMAVYDDLEKDIKITVNGSSKYYKYGDAVPCVSDAADFMYWTKTVNGVREIVSTMPEYTFNAWEDCVVEAVCGDEKISLAKSMRRIILGTYKSGDASIVIAEFIGFDDALEKGIMFDAQQIAMSSKNSQFAVTNDTGKAVNVTGYAIIGTSGNLKKITDGEIVAAK